MSKTHPTPAALDAWLLGARAARRALSASDVRLMLAETADGPFTAEGWWFELKLDGFRALASRENGRIHLRLRGGSDAAARFPEVVAALDTLPGDRWVLDGELVCLDEEGRPIFHRLLGRSQRGGARAREARECPASFFAFDLLGHERFDLRGLPLRLRKEALRMLLPAGGPVRFVDHVETQGEAFFAEVKRLGLEGVIAKRADAPYRPGRQSCWRKVALARQGDFAVVGCAPDFGALHLAVREGDALVYCGKVGSGFGPSQLRQVKPRLEELRKPRATCGGALPPKGEVVWLEPSLVCEVRYKDWPSGMFLRQPVFLRIREDKAPLECERPRELTAPAALAADDQARGVQVSNPRKVFFPDDGIRKEELVAYYGAVAPWLLPYLKDRPVVLTRFPDGIRGKSFFQKHLSHPAPPPVRTVRLSESAGGPEEDFFLCDSPEAIQVLANLGTIPLHLWSSRVDAPDRPDWCILDLDPKEAPFSDVLTLALAARRLCEDIGLPSFVKTTGSSGLHVLVPLGRQANHVEATTLAEILVSFLHREHPGISTLARARSQRGGKVYLDWLQNGRGRLLVAPFAVRPLPGAPVSMTLEWSEVDSGLTPRQFTLRNALVRLERRGDPMAGVLSLAPDLPAALERLQRRATGG